MSPSPKQRHRARSFAVQAVYQWQVASGELAALKSQYISKNDYLKVDWIFFQNLLDLVLKNLNELDQLIAPYIDRGEDSIHLIERAILRLAVAELKFRLDVPFKVVLDQYIGLAAEFGAEGGDKFVNGVLDKLAKALRSLEYNEGRA